MKTKKVTDIVKFGDNGGNWLPIYKCVCGNKLGGWGDFVISTDSDDPNRCPECGAKLFFTIKIKVYQVKKGN